MSRKLVPLAAEAPTKLETHQAGLLGRICLGHRNRIQSHIDSFEILVSFFQEKLYGNGQS
jgi:hypothetical protein